MSGLSARLLHFNDWRIPITTITHFPPNEQMSGIRHTHAQADSAAAATATSSLPQFSPPSIHPLIHQPSLLLSFVLSCLLSPPPQRGDATVPMKGRNVRCERGVEVREARR